MIEELLVTTGTINQGKSNKFVVLINEQFDELRTMLAIPYEDLIAIQ
ncbi:hypothetical protein KA013_01795 [Patescibacteria group bacterium]|jgi:hypothetical protein|nr:hypothetical protein [Patescibacteria group bacterium]